MAIGLQPWQRMRALTSGLVVAAGLALAGSVAHAAPHSAGRHKKPRIEAARELASDAAPAESIADRRDGDGVPAAPSADRRGGDAGPAAQRALDADVADGGPGNPAAGVATLAQPPAGRDWQIAIGPYLWASSVEASVSLGGLSAGVDIGFLTLARHARFGAEGVVEVRHGRLAFYGDVMYGSAAVTGSTRVASVMMTLTGSASSTLIDGAAGYQVLGDDGAPLAIEARGGVRYQRTAVGGELGIAGFALQTPTWIDEGSDALVGVRGVVRPRAWLALSGVLDVGVFGASDRTWSGSLDASLRVSSRVVVSVGWRTLTMERAQIRMEMRGPRAAVQLVLF